MTQKISTNIFSLIKRFKQLQFYVMLTLVDDDCRIHRFSYNRSSKKITESRSFLVKNVSEKNISENKILRTILKVIYYPFQYHLLLNVPHQLCQSRYEVTHMRREKPSQTIGSQELNSFFTHAIWKLVEKNKKLFIARHKYDDVNILLAQNSLVKMSAGNKEILFESEDSIATRNGVDIHVGIVQTYLYRPIFSQLSKILPKRIKIRSILENGFGVAYSIGQEQKTKHSLVCIVERNHTQVFFASRDEVSHAGSFHFGTQSVYEACNNMLGIGMESYRSMLDRCIKNDLSLHAKKFIEKIISDEISRLEKGLLSFKKELASKDAYVEAGNLNHFISLQKKFPAKIIDQPNADWDMYALKAVEYALSLERESFTRNSMQKLFRWLMPNSIE